MIRRPLLLLVPLLLEAALWLAPVVTMQPFVRRLAQGLIELQVTRATSPDEVLTVAQQAVVYSKMAGNVNILGLFAWQMPNIVGGEFDTGRGVLGVETPAGAAATIAAVVVGAIFIGALYLGLLGTVVREGRVHMSEFAERFPVLLVRFAAFIALLVGVYAAALVGGAAVMGMATIGGPVLISMAVGLVIAGGLMLIVHVFLGEEAVVVGGARPVEALRESISIARAGFWSVMGLLLIVLVLRFGLGLVWSTLTREPVGMIAAIVGNTFVGTGTIAGVMVYYKGRSPRIRSAMSRDVSHTTSGIRQSP